MRSHAPLKPIVTKFCMWGRSGVRCDYRRQDLWKSVKGLQSYRTPPQTPFPIVNVHRPYNSVSIPCCTVIRRTVVLDNFIYSQLLSLLNLLHFTKINGPKDLALTLVNCLCC